MKNVILGQVCHATGDITAKGQELTPRQVTVATDVRVQRPIVHPLEDEAEMVFDEDNAF